MDPGYHKRRHETLEYLSWEHSSSMSVWIRDERVSLVSRYCDSPEDVPLTGVIIGVLGSSLVLLELLVNLLTYFCKNSTPISPIWCVSYCSSMGVLSWGSIVWSSRENKSLSVGCHWVPSTAF